MTDAALGGLLVAYAAALASGSWLAERLPGTGRFSSPWAREEAARFRKGMARVVRLIAAFLLAAALVRFRETARVAWPALFLLLALAGADVLASRRAGPPRTQRPTP